MSLQLSKAVCWLGEKSQSMKYGELVIKVIIHEGEVTRVERTCTEKLQEENG